MKSKKLSDCLKAAWSLYFTSFCLSSALLIGAGVGGCADASSSNEEPANAVGVGEITFNQRWLEQRWARATNGAAAERFGGFRPMAAGGTRASESAIQSNLNFDDPASVLTFVLLSAPREAVVYPTEQYFYYQFALGGRLVAGNLRFVESPQRIWVGYFNRYDQSDLHARSFDASDGLVIEQRTTDQGTVVDLAWRGTRRSFLLPTAWKRSVSECVHKGEKLISGTLDESGVPFGLVYHEETHDLLYVLNERAPAPEQFFPHTTGKHKFLIGQDSKFIFYRDDDRWILVGVHQDAIRENTYFDGPFDQIPPELNIREPIERCYPYVKAAGGIDDNGNFLQMSGQRIAISPYAQYAESPLQFCEHAAQLMDEHPDVSWRILTFEPKRLLGRPLNELKPDSVPADYRHSLDVSKQWPASHFPTQSLAK